MIRILALCSALALTPLAACQTIPTSPFEQSLKDEKALYAAESAYFGAATAAEAAVDSGALRGERATQVANLLQTAYSALLVARQAQAAGDAFSVSASSSQVLGAVASAYSLIRN